MIEWTDTDISFRLALAIGWRDDKQAKDGGPDPDVVLFSKDYWRESWCAVWFDGEWRKFDYRDPAVIWPIAERFDCFPRKTIDGWKCIQVRPYDLSKWRWFADTAAKAVAIAVIKSKELE